MHVHAQAPLPPNTLPHYPHPPHHLPPLLPLPPQPVTAMGLWLGALGSVATETAPKQTKGWNRAEGILWHKGSYRAQWKISGETHKDKHQHREIVNPVYMSLVLLTNNTEIHSLLLFTMLLCTSLDFKWINPPPPPSDLLYYRMQMTTLEMWLVKLHNFLWFSMLCIMESVQSHSKLFSPYRCAFCQSNCNGWV